MKEDLEKQEVPEDLKETPKQRSLDRKVILIVSIFLALVLFGAIAVMSKTKSQNSAPKPIAQTTPSPSPTPNFGANWKIDNSQDVAGWKKYTNNQYPYSFELPSNWTFTAQEQGALFESPQLADEKPRDPRNTDILIQVSKLQMVPSNDIESYFNYEYAHATVPKPKYSLTSVNGVKAISFRINTGEEYGNTVQFINNGLFYSIDNGFLGNFSNSASIFNQMLSTFKFTQ